MTKFQAQTAATIRVNQQTFQRAIRTASTSAAQAFNHQGMVAKTMRDNASKTYANAVKHDAQIFKTMRHHDADVHVTAAKHAREAFENTQKNAEHLRQMQSQLGKPGKINSSASAVGGSPAGLIGGLMIAVTFLAFHLVH